MVLKLITAPAEEPVRLAELKAYARIDHSDDDVQIEGLGRAAREYVEAVTGEALMAQTWELRAREWPGVVIALPKPPLASVTTVKHRTPSGVLITLTADVDYIVDTAGGTIEPLTRWPVAGDYPDAVQIRFVAGYANADAVPQRFKLALAALALHWYDVPGPVVPGDGETRRVPFHVKAMLAQLRGGRLEMAT